MDLGYFPTNDMQTPSPRSFEPIFIDDEDCAEWNEKRNIFFSYFFFLSYHEKFIENWGDDVTKMTVTRKKKSEKSEI